MTRSRSSGPLAGRLGGLEDVALDPGDDLIEVEAGAVDDLRVLRGLHRGDGPGGVAGVAFPEVAEDRLGRERIAPGGMLGVPPAGPFEVAGREEVFPEGIGKDDSPLVTPLGDHPALGPRERPLPFDQPGLVPALVQTSLPLDQPALAPPLVQTPLPFDQPESAPPLVQTPLPFDHPGSVPPLVQTPLPFDQPTSAVLHHGVGPV